MTLGPLYLPDIMAARCCSEKFLCKEEGGCKSSSGYSSGCVLHHGVDVLVLVEQDAGVPLVRHLGRVLLEFADFGLRVHDWHLAVQVRETLRLEPVLVALNHNRALAGRVVIALAC